MRLTQLRDSETEPDATMTFVRYLTCANHFDTEGSIATTSITSATKSRRTSSSPH